MTRKTLLGGALLVALVPLFAGCGGNEAADTNNTTTTDAGSSSDMKLTGRFSADGSSTVYPITAAIVEEFRKTHPDVRISVAQSGTGGGFKKFAVGDTALSNASRPIKDGEIEKAKTANVEFIELPVAFDGLSIVTNKANEAVNCLTTAELKKIWDQGSKVNNWSQVRAALPSRQLKLYGPGTDSGTFDYFTDEINGEEGKSRSDYTASEDDNVLVQGVSRDPGALGYFGYAYFEENADKLKLVEVDAGEGCVAPSNETIASGQYAPLSRPLFLYVSKNDAQRPEVREFVRFYLKNAKDIVGRVGYVPLPDEVYEAVLERFEAGTAGSVYGAEGAKEKSLLELYSVSGATTEATAAAPAS